MPWSASDAPKHNKSADTPSKKKKWARIANAILRKSGDEGKAIRIANSKIEHNCLLGRILDSYSG